MLPAQTKIWVIPADLANINPICSEISAWLKEQFLYQELFPFELLAREALNNAIIHGCEMDASRNVHAELQRNGGTLQLKVRDEGSGFHWRTALAGDMVADDQEGGRGLKLYQLYADHIEFNESGNEVILSRSIKN